MQTTHNVRRNVLRLLYLRCPARDARYRFLSARSSRLTNRGPDPAKVGPHGSGSWARRVAFLLARDGY